MARGHRAEDNDAGRHQRCGASQSGHAAIGGRIAVIKKLTAVMENTLAYRVWQAPFAVRLLGVTLWHLVYFKGRRKS